MRRVLTTGMAIAALGTAALGALPAAAQTAGWTQGWSGQATLYGWLPVINGKQEGPGGQPLIDLDTSDVLSALDMAFMGSAIFQRDRFGILLDAVYADLGTDGTWIQNRVSTSTNTKLGMYTAAAFYRVHDADRAFFDVYGGARYFDTSVDFELSSTRLRRSFRSSLTWTDAVAGVRGGLPLSERWSLTGFADVGGFDSGSDLTWQVYGGANYDFSENWFATIGYRYVSIEKEVTERATLDIDMQGPLLGISYRF
jgi:opacity protein-like surface antigen